MQHVKTASKRRALAMLASSRNAQAAKMTLRPGGASDEQPSNEHPRAEQWLFVVSGSGVATVGRSRKSLRRVRLSENSLLLIEKGELHQIRNTGRAELTTINLYVPPAYAASGDPKKSVTNGGKTA